MGEATKSLAAEIEAVPLTEAQFRALRLIDSGATRISDLKRERVSRVTIDRLSGAGLIDTGRFPGAVYSTAKGHAVVQPTPTTEDKGREDLNIFPVLKDGDFRRP